VNSLEDGADARGDRGIVEEGLLKAKGYEQLDLFEI
jgi:hypothetical protein